MIGIDKPTGRVVALVVMLVVAAVALRGYLPGAERAAPREQPTNGAASLLAVVALVTASLVIIAIAIIARLRDRRPVPARAGGLPESFGGSGMRPTWRFWLIGLGADHRLAAHRPTAGPARRTAGNRSARAGPGAKHRAAQ